VRTTTLSDWTAILEKKRRCKLINKKITQFKNIITSIIVVAEGFITSLISMGGEHYRYMRCTKEPSEEYKAEYAKLFLSLAIAIQKWWQDRKDQEGWEVEFDDDIRINSPGMNTNDIIIPKVLGNKLTVGWQDFSYGDEEDPKKELAETLMTILKNSRRLAEILVTEEEDNTDDLYDRDDYYQDEPEPFTPSTGWYSTGDGDRVFCFEGGSPDYTACGSECGYCGRCQY
jgi:hypothetical protein